MMPLGNWFRPSGLSVLCIINNTTAAAIVYGWIGHCVNIFILNLGGGTLNISLLTLGNFEVAAINRDVDDGAEDFDQVVDCDRYGCIRRNVRDVS